MSQIVNMLNAPAFPEFVYAMVLSYLDENREHAELIEILRRYSGSVVYRYHIGNILFGNGIPLYIDDTPDVIQHFDNGQLCYIAWMNDQGQLHREDGPAVIMYRRFKISHQIWVTNGFIQNTDPDQPSMIFHGRRPRKVWCQRLPLGLEDFVIDSDEVIDFDLHLIADRNVFPSEITYYETGQVKSESGFVENALHSIVPEEPSFIKYYPNGAIESKQWHQRGMFSRPLGLPQTIYYYPSGAISLETFYNRRGNRSRCISYHESGEIKKDFKMSHEIAKLRGTFVEGEEPINEYSEDSILDAQGLLDVDRE